MRRLGSWVLMIACLGGAVSAQTNVGDPMPPIKVKKFINGKAKSLRELKGKLILFEYFAHW